jgi:hypothetical protein
MLVLIKQLMWEEIIQIIHSLWAEDLKSLDWMPNIQNNQSNDNYDLKETLEYIQLK